jgi:hypothetical protein
MPRKISVFLKIWGILHEDLGNLYEDPGKKRENPPDKPGNKENIG